MSLASEETYINIESPLNSTYIGNYIEPEESITSSVINGIDEAINELKEEKSNTIEKLIEIKETKTPRPKKEKKKVQPIVRPTLYKYTVSGNVKNSKGRFKFTDIIEAQSETLAQDIFKQRAKKEYSGVRAINKIEINLYKDGDIKSSEEIVENLVKTETNIDIMSDEDLAVYILKTVITITHSNLYKVAYIPVKKKSFIKRAPKLYYVAKSEAEMKISVKKDIDDMGLPYNEKYIVATVVTSEKDIKETGAYDKILEKVKTLSKEDKDTLKDFFDQITNEKVPTNLADVITELPNLLLGDFEITEHIKKKLKDDKDKEEGNVVIAEDENGKKSLLGSKYKIVYDYDSETNKINKIFPNIPVFMNMDQFKKYHVTLTAKGIDVLDCDVLAESKDLAIKYAFFTCEEKKMLSHNEGVNIRIITPDGNVISSFATPDN